MTTWLTWSTWHAFEPESSSKEERPTDKWTEDESEEQTGTESEDSFHNIEEPNLLEDA